ncbi:MAG TPA: hypothetical protein PKD26_04265 [Pyrinomonadaceae bacterium]|nr:hypothetical protein [Pyrinomonadaceae bacterium]
MARRARNMARHSRRRSSLAANMANKAGHPNVLRCVVSKSRKPLFGTFDRRLGYPAAVAFRIAI